MQQKLNQWFSHSLSVPTFGGHFQYYMFISIKQIKRYDMMSFNGWKLKLNRVRPEIKLCIFKGGWFATIITGGAWFSARQSFVINDRYFHRHTEAQLIQKLLSEFDNPCSLVVVIHFSPLIYMVFLPQSSGFLSGVLHTCQKMERIRKEHGGGIWDSDK